VATRDTRGMEQHLSVRICGERVLARPWLPPRAFIVSGVAAFSSVLALRARTIGCSWRVGECRGQSSFDVRWRCHAGGLRLPLCLASGTQCKTDE
jgi:hypothetical protein